MKIGSTVGRIIDWCQERWYKLAWLTLGIIAVYCLYDIADSLDIITFRFWQFTHWFMEWAKDRGTLS